MENSFTNKPRSNKNCNITIEAIAEQWVNLALAQIEYKKQKTKPKINIEPSALSS